MRCIFSILLLFFVCSAVAQNAAGKAIKVIQLENNQIALVFDPATGALTKMINKKTGDNYIKQATGRNLFRLYVNTNRMPTLSAGPHNESYGGLLIDPSAVVVKDYRLSKENGRSELMLKIRPRTFAADVIVTITLADTTNYFDCSLAVINRSDSACRVYSSLPYFSGISMGSKPETNLAINMWDRGYPGIKAWEKNSGGVYGRDVSMQWQCVYEPALDEGLAFITMDTSFSNKILTCFPEGGMQSLYFDTRTILPGNSFQWPTARVVVFNGNWRTAAKLYQNWAEGSIKPRPIPQWYTDEVAIRGSTWIPTKEGVEKIKSAKQKDGFTSFNQLLLLYKGGYSDCLEMAMWNEGVHLWPETYGPWMSSGFLDFRSDLGGRKAFEEGVKEVHRFGRKVVMYVAGYGIRTTSPLFKENDWKNWAIVNNEKGEINFGYRGEKESEIYGIFNCLGYKPWQDNIIRVCTMLAKAGVDEIRLDEIGFPFKPCFNKAHYHSSPYDSQLWTREYLGRIRDAMDKINPQLVISTEFFMDYFHTYTNGALVMDCSGKEIDVMKVALPQYMAMSYHAGAAEAAITGAVMGKPEAYRQNWAWAHVGTERPDDYPSGAGEKLPYYELYPTFAATLLSGNITNKDPVAQEDVKWAGHLWKNKDYWLLTGGHDDLSTLPSGEMEVTLPELPEKFTHAFEFNVQTLEMKKTVITRSGKKLSVKVHHPLSLVFFPSASCPPLPVIEQMDKTFSVGSVMQVTVKLFAPWNPASEKRNASSIVLKVPGFDVSKIKLKGNTVYYKVSIGGAVAPGYYFLQVAQHCMPLKKWFTVQ
jgi:hypothetical protein